MPLLEVDEGKIYFTARGAGIPIVFIHPPVLTSVNFEYQIDELSKDFQVITFDIRGHGKSPYSPKPITYELIVEDIIKILNHLEIKKAFIAGYSTGGSITLEYMLTYPDRALGGIVISGMSEVCDPILKNELSLAIKLASAGSVSLLSWGTSLTNSNNKKLFDKMFHEAKKGDARNVEQYYWYSKNYNCTSQLKNIHLPVKLIFGLKNKQFYSYARILRDNLPNYEFNFIKNGRHWLPTKNANEVNQLIFEFVKRNSPSNRNILWT
ncbi:alpha/beta fold hydrolase [Cytobacillus sp. Hz8]|uniref:alpha/beta fold hydrolase n=1 Tax=Cytobacillus sp. Hz8 TaxID=3347168 RepID=UPI0035D87323